MQDQDSIYIRTYDVRIACIDEIGLNGAMILSQLQYWIRVTQKQAATNEAVRKKHCINGKWWIYNTFEQWQEQFPFWSTRTIMREFKKLEKSGVVITGRFNQKGYDQTKWYTVSEKVLESLMNTHCDKLATITPMTNCHNATEQSVTTNTKEYTNNNYIEGKRDFLSEDKKPTHLNKPINYQILKGQVQKICDEYHSGSQEYCFDILSYYLKKYETNTGQNHPCIKSDNLKRIIDVLCEGTELFEPTDSEQWKTLIDNYFDTPFENCDYRINHFLSNGGINYRFYEELY